MDVIRASIKTGSVYYFHAKEFHSNNYHYFVVLTVNAATEDVILVGSSSKVAKVKKRNTQNPPETLIEVSPKQYPGFTVPSIFDCNNNVIEHKIGSLTKSLSNHALLVKPEIDKVIVKKLSEGVLASPMIAQSIQNRLKTS